MEVFRVLGTKSTSDPDHEPPKRLSRKEFARQFRHAAYLRAKEFRKTDPRQIAMKERLKEQRKEAARAFRALHSNSRKAFGERNKTYRDAIKNAANERAGKKKAIRQNKLKVMVGRGRSIKKSTHEMRS
jgi:hypothetical protein